MELEQWRIEKGLSYENLARDLELTTSKAYRLCQKDPCIKLVDAHKIVTKTEGRVDYCDMLLEGC